jgi:hypothetical protein
MVISLLTIVFISLAWGVVTGMAALRKNRSFAAWFAAGCCMWFLPLIALILMKRLRPFGMDEADFGITQVPTTIFPDTRIP